MQRIQNLPRIVKLTLLPGFAAVALFGYFLFALVNNVQDDVQKSVTGAFLFGVFSLFGLIAREEENILISRAIGLASAGLILVAWEPMMVGLQFIATMVFALYSLMALQPQQTRNVFGIVCLVVALLFFIAWVIADSRSRNALQSRS